MQKTKILQINNNTIYFNYIEGQWWIAIKPICQALGVDYSRQLRTLKSDVFLGAVWSLQTIQVGVQKREMACLPERFIYGWVFSLNSNSELLIKYKMKCYDILYDYFHSKLSKRADTLKEKTKKEMELEEVEKKLEETAEYIRLKELKDEIKVEKRNLNKLDSDFVQENIDLWTQDFVTENF